MRNNPNSSSPPRPLSAFAATIWWTVTVVCAATLGGCFEPADQRADLDQRLGHAESGGTAVDVEGGLAAIREVTSDHVTLWAKAPTFVARIHSSVPRGTFTVTVLNALPDLTVGARNPDGYDVHVASMRLPADPETVRRWSVDFSTTTDVDLNIGPADAYDIAGAADAEAADADVHQPWRFIVYGDVQERIDQVQDIYRLMRAEPGVRFAMFTGDLTKRGDPVQLGRFEDETMTLPFPWYATLGNHELGTEDDMFHRRFGRGTSHFKYRGVAFTLIDSASATLSGLVYDWLDRWLDDSVEGMHMVFMHIPPLDPFGLRGGSFASRNEAAGLLARLAAGRVDATFYGHIHSYYEFTNAGIPAFISGGGGSYPEKFDGIGRHFLVVDVSPSDGRFTTRVVRVDPGD